MKKLLFAVLAAAAVTLCAQDMILRSGKYRIHFSQKEHFCSSQYFYDDVELGRRTGFYGTIFAPQNVKFIGSGHTEGGVEKVLETKVVCDGKTSAAAPGEISGSKIEFDKVSLLGNLKVTAKFTLTPEEIRIDKDVEAVADQQVYSLYVFQYCWSDQLKEWMIGRPDGSTDSGVCRSNEGWFLRGKESELLWHSLYDPEKQTALIGYFSSYFPGQGSYFLWDRKIYHKFYFSAKMPKLMKKGTRMPHYSMVIRFLKAAPDTWKQTVQAEAAALEKRFPLPPPPAVIEFKEPVVIRGNGKFVCKKLPLALARNAEYEISYQVKKSPEVSTKGHYSSMIAGQYTRDRKFVNFRTLGAQSPADDAFHEVKGSFRTGDEIFDANLYLYNMNSTGTVEVKDIRVIRKENK